MKTKTRFAIGAALALLLGTVIGCAALSSPPTAAEHLAYDVVTNYVDVPVIKQVVEVVTVTNTIGQTVTETNRVYETNIVSQPVYDLTPKAAVTAGIQTGGAALNVVAPGIGSMVSAGLLALLAIWGHIRGYNGANTSQSLAQEIETMREFISSLPNGAKYDTAIVQFLQSHQMENGVAQSVLKILNNNVSNPDAKAALTEINATLTQLGAQVPKPVTP